MKLWWLCLFLIAGCSAVNRGRRVDSPPPLPDGHSSLTLTSFVSRAQPILEVVTPPIHHFAYTWDYPVTMPADNISFDFEGSTNLVDWYLIVNTNQPPVRFDTYQSTEFYRVGAHWIIDPN